MPSRPISLASTHSTSSSFFRSSKDKRTKNKAFNLEKEKPRMLETIAQAHLASTNLLNALKLINRENERVSDNAEAVNRFETCKVLRRQILRYIQLVESEQFIGSLLSANDALVTALMGYEVFDKGIDEDSDSDADAYHLHKAIFNSRTPGQKDVEELSMASVTLSDAPPPKPTRPPGLQMPANPMAGKSRAHDEDDDDEDVEEEDEDKEDPFGDAYSVDKTPRAERAGMTWRDV